MKRMTMMASGSVVAAGLALALAAPAAAQGTKPAGIVTTLQGTANVKRVVATQEQVFPLKFRAEVLPQDLVTTGDQSLARILLGGKAVVTVREHSSLRITDNGTTATVDISSGRIALAVAKERMKPGERIDVRTPNAVAGVRGTVLITEVGQLTASAAEQPAGGLTTRFTLLSGIVDVSLLDASGRPRGAGFTLNPLQSVGITGFTPPPPPRSITASQGQAAANAYKVNYKDAPGGTNSQITERQVEAATNAAAATAGGGPRGVDTITTIVKNNSQPTNPITVLPPGCGSSCTEKTTIQPSSTVSTTICRNCCECPILEARPGIVRRR